MFCFKHGKYHDKDKLINRYKYHSYRGIQKRPYLVIYEDRKMNACSGVYDMSQPNKAIFIKNPKHIKFGESRPFLQSVRW